MQDLAILYMLKYAYILLRIIVLVFLRWPAPEKRVLLGRPAGIPVYTLQALALYKWEMPYKT